MLNDPFSSGLVLPLLYSYGAGFLSSLTPCVYPLIPITLAHFGAYHAPTRLHAFGRSLCFVAGMAATYTALGMFSAKTGAMFGSLLGQWYVVFPLAIFFTLMGLYTLGIFQIPGVQKMQVLAGRVGGGGPIGSFMMGSVSGLVAAPCVGPALVAILAIAAKSQTVFWGGALLFAYSIGLGTLFIVLGTFVGLLDRLPRSGNWLNGVKVVMSAGIFALVFFLIKPFLFHSSSHNAASQLSWLTDPQQAIEHAAKKEGIVMIDFFAEWCAACKEYESETFSDPRVYAELEKVVPVRVDLTTMDEELEQLQDKYKVVGLPTILFLDAFGAEIPGTRLDGFKNAKEFLKHLDKVRTTAQLLAELADHRQGNT